jgi:hypothetical protein
LQLQLQLMTASKLPRSSNFPCPGWTMIGVFMAQCRAGSDDAARAQVLHIMPQSARLADRKPIRLRSPARRGRRGQQRREPFAERDGARTADDWRPASFAAMRHRPGV